MSRTLLPLAALAVIASIVLVLWPQPAESDEPAVADVPAAIERPESLSLMLSAALELDPEATEPPPFTLSERQRLADWMKDRGYLFDLSIGGRSGGSSASGYDATDDATLRTLAASGDRIAAMSLGSRLADRRANPGDALPPDAVLREAVALLLQATVLGHTASLDRLAELARVQSLWRGRCAPTSASRPSS